MASHFHIWYPGQTGLPSASSPRSFPVSSAQAASFACDRLLRLMSEVVKSEVDALNQNYTHMRHQHHHHAPTITACRNPFDDLPENGPWLEPPQLQSHPFRFQSPLFRFQSPPQMADNPMSSPPTSPASHSHSSVSANLTPERFPRWAFFSDSSNGSSPVKSNLNEQQNRNPFQNLQNLSRRPPRADPLQIAIDCDVQGRLAPTDTVAQFAVTRQRSDSGKRTDICRFCFERAVKYNERYGMERPHVDDASAEWTQHIMRDPVTHKVECPRLRNVKCEICSGTGDNAHVAQFCPWLRDSNFLASKFGRNNNRLES